MPSDDQTEERDRVRDDSDTAVPAVPVVFVSSHARPGGSERYLELLLGELGSAWVDEVVVLEEGPLSDRLRQLGYRVHTIQTSGRKVSLLLSAWKLRRLLAVRTNPVVHANGIKAAVVSVVAAVGTSARVLWVKHDFSWDGALARLISARSNRVVAVSAAVASALEGAASGKIEVVHNGLPVSVVDRHEARHRVLECVGATEPTSVVSVVGRLDPVKGQRAFVQMIPNILESVPDLRVLFVGGEDASHWAYARDLRDDVMRYELQHVVTFVGHSDRPLDFIAGSDAIAMPTARLSARLGREGFPYVALEAMSAGTPVVGYDDGGLPETLGSCGLLVSSGDAAGFCEALTRVLKDPAEARAFARCGRERAKRFTLANTVRSMKSVYLEMARQ